MGAMKRLSTKLCMGQKLSVEEKDFLKVNDPASYFRIYGGKVAVAPRNPSNQLDLFSPEPEPDLFTVRAPQPVEQPEEPEGMDEWVERMESEERGRMDAAAARWGDM